MGNFNLRFSVENGNNLVEVREPGRTVRIEHGVNGIDMLINPGMEDGKEVTRHYQARTPEELARQHPEAFEMFHAGPARPAQRGTTRQQRTAASRRTAPAPRRGRSRSCRRRRGSFPRGSTMLRELRDRIRRQHNLPGDAAAKFDASSGKSRGSWND